MRIKNFPFIIFLVLLFSSCQENQTHTNQKKTYTGYKSETRPENVIQPTISTNQNLDSSLNNLIRPTKFIFAEIVINESVPDYDNASKQTFYKDEINIYVTNIEEVKNYDENKKYEIKDEARRVICSLRQSCDIKEIIIHEYDSYAEASQKREQIKYIREERIVFPI